MVSLERARAHFVSIMEPAIDLLARQLPPLNYHRGTTGESVSLEKLAAEYMYP